MATSTKAVAAKRVKVLVGLNNHPIAKKRDLTDDEKATIRTFFLRANGIIKNDASLKIKERLGKGVSSFQIVGAIIGLHRQVQNGVLKVRDLTAYKENLQARRRLWKTYKSHKYQPKKFPEPKPGSKAAAKV